MTLDGADIYAPGVDPVDLRRRVGMIFQQPNPFPMSIYDNVAYGPRLQGVKKKAELDEIVEESLKRANLWKEVKDILGSGRARRSPAGSSSGCASRACSRCSPRCCSMDEPCSAIDPTSVQKIEDLMAELKDTVTIVIVTHNMQQAARVSDFTAFFLQEEAGEPAVLVEYDRTADLFTSPQRQADRGLHHRPVRLGVAAAGVTAM